MVECVVASADDLGEVVVWCQQTQCLWWVDVVRARIHEWYPATNRHAIHPTQFRRIGSIALRQAGGLLLATEQGLFTWSASTGATRWTESLEPEHPEFRLNDGRCDRAGRFWVGSMHDTEFIPVGSLFRVEPDRTASRLEQNIIVPNSVAFSPDDRTFYFADTRRHTIWAYDFDLRDGEISNRRIFTTFEGRPGRPDGSCVDADGCLWNASYAGAQIVRYTPKGKIDRVIDLPVTCPTCCCFGGPRLDTLFITSARVALSEDQKRAQPLAGALLAINPGTTGLPEPTFGG